MERAEANGLARRLASVPAHWRVVVTSPTHLDAADLERVTGRRPSPEDSAHGEGDVSFRRCVTSIRAEPSPSSPSATTCGIPGAPSAPVATVSGMAVMTVTAKKAAMTAVTAMTVWISS